MHCGHVEWNAYKTLIGMSSYKFVFGKTYPLLVKLKHKTYLCNQIFLFWHSSSWRTKIVAIGTIGGVSIRSIWECQYLQRKDRDDMINEYKRKISMLGNKFFSSTQGWPFSRMIKAKHNTRQHLHPNRKHISSHANKMSIHIQHFSYAWNFHVNVFKDMIFSFYLI